MSKKPATQPKKPNRSRPTTEARLDQGVTHLTGQTPSACPPEEWSNLREQLRLQVLYPGEYVAVRYGTAAGHHASKGRGQEVLCHSRSLAEVQDYGAALPADQQQDVWLDYVEETPRLSAR